MRWWKGLRDSLNNWSMTLVISLDVAELAATRFAASPLCETIRAVQLLGAPQQPSVNRPWLDWARHQLDQRPLHMPRLWPLVVNGLPNYPEFLMPAPATQWPLFADELARLAATAAGPVRASLCRVFGEGPWPDSARELFEQPRKSLREITAELAECHERLIAPHWERIRAVLDADIAYRTGVVASGGARHLFADMHANLSWTAGTLTLSDAGNDSVFHVRKGPDGVVLIPCVFAWPDVSVSKATSTQTILLYPARGAANVWSPLGDDGVSGTPAEHLLGVPRARLLSAVRSPATTTTLARQLGVTPSAVSQHLAFLHRGQLVQRQRRGRAVLYQTSDLGLALLRAPGGAGADLTAP
jgi:DNA-binding transcriptional ArsR family regulator